MNKVDSLTNVKKKFNDLKNGLGMMIRKPLFKKYYNLTPKYALYIMKIITYHNMLELIKILSKTLSASL